MELVRYYSTKFARIQREKPNLGESPKKKHKKKRQKPNTKERKRNSKKIKRNQREHKLLKEEVGGLGHRVRV
jgi:hypothetical protein